MRATAALLLMTVMVLPVPGRAQDQSTGVDVQLRGISAVSANVAWASGANGTILRTLDSGRHWQKLAITGADKLDFRNVRAFDAKTAYVLSIGPGEQSRIYKTLDGGRHWQIQFTNHDPKAFYDCFAFWDRDYGIALSDSVDGKFPLLVTDDGATWKPLVPQTLPPALPNEGAFAASGTCIAVYGRNDVWFATGGPAARVFHSANRGKNWTVVTTPIISGAPSQGIFSIAFRNAKQGVIVGGDYKQPENTENTAAYTQDGGQTWTLASHMPHGYRSGVAFTQDSPQSDFPMLVAVGTNGVDFSSDEGRSWAPYSQENCNAVSTFGSNAWHVGPHGSAARAGFTSHSSPNYPTPRP